MKNKFYRFLSPHYYVYEACTIVIQEQLGLQSESIPVVLVFDSSVYTWFINDLQYETF